MTDPAYRMKIVTLRSPETHRNRKYSVDVSLDGDMLQLLNDRMWARGYEVSSVCSGSLADHPDGLPLMVRPGYRSRRDGRVSMADTMVVVGPQLGIVRWSFMGRRGWPHRKMLQALQAIEGTEAHVGRTRDWAGYGFTFVDAYAEDRTGDWWTDVLAAIE